jgi:hypothetical protein
VVARKDNFFRVFGKRNKNGWLGGLTGFVDYQVVELNAIMRQRFIR